MDVIFEVEGKEPFSIEVGFFDTILEFKEKVQKYQGIPISKQTLIFNGQVLPDDGDVWKCKIFQDSRIQLLVTPEPEPVKRRRVMVEKEVRAPLEMDFNETVLKLKERICETEHVSMDNLVLYKAGIELHDHQLLRDCDDSEFSVTVRSSSATVPAATVAAGTGVGGRGRGSKKLNAAGTGVGGRGRGSKKSNVAGTGVGGRGGRSKKSNAAGTGVGGRGGGSKKSNTADTGVGGREGGSEKLKIMILPKSGAEKIPIEVNASDNVEDLMNELQKLHQSLQIDLPQRYFFIHKKAPMRDYRSFQWHGVGQGDTIEIFPW